MKVNDYFDFVEERIRVYRRKEVRNESPPWTDDRVLQTTHICNVRREWDTGTEYYLEQIVPNLESKTDAFYETVAYRLINKPQTWAMVADDLRNGNFDAVATDMHAVDFAPFGTAYRIGLPRGDNEGKIDKVVYGIFEDDLYPNRHQYKTILDETDPEVINDRLAEITGLGPFVAYEVYTDLNYWWFDFSENDFVNIGLGAADALDRIYPERTSDVEAIERLWDIQNDYLPDDIAELTYRNIEHSLCEWNSYLNAKVGNPSRTYDQTAP